MNDNEIKEELIKDDLNPSETASTESFDPGKAPIKMLKPESKLHQAVLKKLLEMIEMSEGEMQNFYPRWQVQEKKVQAYIDLPKWEKVLKELNDKGKSPTAIDIVVPYSFATISTIVTYLIHTFAGRKPMFQVGTNKAENTNAARLMEIVLQYNAEHTRIIKHMFQFLNDGELYGLAVLRTKWKEEKAMRTVWRKKNTFGFFNMLKESKMEKEREYRTIYSGNEVASVDPFMFFPDPRVPMTEVNKRGEFVFWRSYEGTHVLKKMERAGEISWVDAIGDTIPESKNLGGDSARNLLSKGEAHPGIRNLKGQAGKAYKQIDQGSVEIVPKDWGLGESEEVEKWIFTIANKSQIIEATPMETDHGMHPIAVAEPYSLGYGFGNAGISDYLGPMQDTVSWLINSHIENVRTALNNMFVVDPSMLVMKDLKEPGPGKIIRLKESARGQDVRSALQQVAVADVTGTHMKDLEMFMRIGDTLSSITDNIRGLQDSGGRKTATEVRTAGEAGASRLAAHARLISSQAFVDLTEQMSLNIQQFLDEEFYYQIVGKEGKEYGLHGESMPAGFDGTGVQIAPEMLTGDFHYPIHDGTLPLDRVALMDLWKELFLSIAGDQQLRSEFNISAIFEHIAELGGARNIDEFKLNVNPMPNAQVADAANAGNIVPTQQVTDGGPVI